MRAVRLVFVAYLVAIVAGIGAYFVVGLLGL
jgi:hypothetical protein